MKPRSLRWIICLLGAGLVCISTETRAAPEKTPVRDVTFFLHRLHTVDHLPQLEDSHTALASTWDRSGGNADGTDFKRKAGTTNILFDADGPGCVHRIFTGGSEPATTNLPGYLRVDGIEPAYSDLQNLRAVDSNVNSSRGNKYYDTSDTNNPDYKFPAHAEAPLCSTDSDSWEPPLYDRGNIARSLFYMESFASTRLATYGERMR
jgi:hypothetical protein